MNELTDRIKKTKRPVGIRNFPDKVKIEAVKLYLMSGSVTFVANALGMTNRCIYIWMTKNWWTKIVEDIRTEGRFKLNNKLKAIVDKSLEVVMDRLESGDFQFNRDTGEVVRVPIKARDAHRIAYEMIDRSQDMEKKETVHNTAVEDRLNQLADAFSQFAKKTHRVEIIDAVSNEREEKLLEGGQLGEETSGTERTKGPENGSQESRGEGGESASWRQSPGGSRETSESWRQQLPRELEGS